MKKTSESIVRIACMSFLAILLAMWGFHAVSPIGHNVVKAWSAGDTIVYSKQSGVCSYPSTSAFDVVDGILYVCPQGGLNWIALNTGSGAGTGAGNFVLTNGGSANQGAPQVTNLTASTLTGTVAPLYTCGAVGSGTTCTQAAAATNDRVAVGSALLAGSTTTVGFSPAFTGSSSMFCWAQDNTSSARTCNCVPIGSGGGNGSITLTATGATDTCSFVVEGH